MGQILAAGAGQNPARQAAIHAGIPVEKTATTINQVMWFWTCFRCFWFIIQLSVVMLISSLQVDKRA